MLRFMGSKGGLQEIRGAVCVKSLLSRGKRTPCLFPLVFRGEGGGALPAQDAYLETDPPGVAPSWFPRV